TARLARWRGAPRCSSCWNRSRSTRVPWWWSTTARSCGGRGSQRSRSRRATRSSWCISSAGGEHDHGRRDDAGHAVHHRRTLVPLASHGGYGEVPGQRHDGPGDRSVRRRDRHRRGPTCGPGPHEGGGRPVSPRREAVLSARQHRRVLHRRGCRPLRAPRPRGGVQRVHQARGNRRPGDPAPRCPGPAGRDTHAGRGGLQGPRLHQRGPGDRAAPRGRGLRRRPRRWKGCWIKDATAARRAALQMLDAVRAGATLQGARDGALASLIERDRRLAYELAAGVLRRRAQLDRMLELATADPRLHDVLRLGAYQLRALARVPAYAAVSTSVELARALAGEKAARYVNQALRKIARETGSEKRETSGATHPSWLVARWRRRFGPTEADRLVAWNDTKPTFTIQPARWSVEALTV